MASKMENWINYQQGHLTPEAFEAWKAGNVKVQSYLKKREGVPRAVQALDDLQKDIWKKVMAPAIQHASDWLASIEKTSAAADKDSGTLAQSIGSTKAKLYQATFCGYVASGPRRGFARAVQLTFDKKGTPKTKRLSKKGTLEAAESLMAGAQHTVIKNPVAYARYLRHGRKAVVARGQRGAILLAKQGGTFFRHGVKAAPAKDFMRDAETMTESANNMAQCDIRLNVQKLLPGD